MRKKIWFLVIIFLAFLNSCEKNEDTLKYESFIEFLSNKTIVSVKITGHNLWILSYQICTNCYIPPYSSHLPSISQLTMVTDETFYYEEPATVWMLATDSRDDIYTSIQNRIYKLNGIRNYKLIIDSGDFQFNYFVPVGNDTFWLGGENGVAHFNGDEIKIYTEGNSGLPSNITHGIAEDHSGNVWITLDFKGLLKITKEDTWEIIPNQQIPGLTPQSYLHSPVVDNEDNIWFQVFQPDTTSGLLRYDGTDWTYEYPGGKGCGRIQQDYAGMIWVITDEHENDSFLRSVLYYFKYGEWKSFDVSGIKNKIITMNADDHYVYTGTVKGLFVVDR